MPIMADDDTDDYVFYGTPLEDAAAAASGRGPFGRAAPPKDAGAVKAPPIWEQEARTSAVRRWQGDGQPIVPPAGGLGRRLIAPRRAADALHAHAAAAHTLLPLPQVTDEQGRRRFHGAFTGGFSAGYYNTVGSAVRRSHACASCRRPPPPHASLPHSPPIRFPRL